MLIIDLLNQKQSEVYIASTTFNILKIDNWRGFMQLSMADDFHNLNYLVLADKTPKRTEKNILILGYNGLGTSGLFEAYVMKDQLDRRYLEEIVEGEYNFDLENETINFSQSSPNDYSNSYRLRMLLVK